MQKQSEENNKKEKREKYSIQHQQGIVDLDQFADISLATFKFQSPYIICFYLKGDKVYEQFIPKLEDKVKQNPGTVLFKLCIQNCPQIIYHTMGVNASPTTVVTLQYQQIVTIRGSLTDQGLDFLMDKVKAMQKNGWNSAQKIMI